MSPKEFASARAQCRASSTSNDNESFHTTVCDRPYFPTLAVDIKFHRSVAHAACAVVSPDEPANVDELRVTEVKGGITNALFKVSNFSNQPFTSVLVRVFGAEGMIDRDAETSAYAALCESKIAYEYLGRFGNGRIEGWLDGYSALDTPTMASGDLVIVQKIAEQLAKLHSSFRVKKDLEPYFPPDKPGMWDQLYSWLDQAKNSVNTKAFKDGTTGVEKADRLFIKDFNVEKELRWLQEEVVPKDAKVVFCHNDLLAANIMIKKEDASGNDSKSNMKVQFIDFEYGGTNYAAFDIANHFNEYAGGTDDGVPNYDTYPKLEAQLTFVETYLQFVRFFENADGGEDASDDEKKHVGTEISSDAVNALLDEVNSFVLADHLYWGLWAINQSAVEGCDSFNYLLYAENRLKRYQDLKN